MSTGALASRSVSRPRMPAAAIAATLALVLGLSLVAAVLLNQPAAPPASIADGHANLAGMGGLANPAPRQESATSGGRLELVARYQNLAGYGGLANPAPRD
jgi:hypothetical protein